MNPSALTNTGNISFSGNLLFAHDLAAAGGRCVEQSTGHLVFYRPDGLRFLATDPEGNPLHECEWGTDATGNAILSRARIQLDWGQWVGLKPAGLVNETSFNLAGKSGWQQLTADDLRSMAAQALRVSLEDVRLFYRDEDLQIEPTGRATIRQRKDAFYVLEGEYRIFVEEEEFACPAGSFIFIPAGARHGFRVGGQPSRKLNLYTPAAMVGYFDELSAAIKSGDADSVLLDKIALQHGMAVIGPVPDGYL